MVNNAPMEVCSRGRLYTSERQRRRLNIDGYGQGTPVRVCVTSVNRSPEWGGVYAEKASFDATLGAYGEVYVPSDAQEQLGLDVGDDVRVSMTRRLTQ